MASPAGLHRYTFAEYLALEDASNTKHEYLHGEIYGMAGGTPEHAALCVAVSAALLTQLRGGAVPGLRLRPQGEGARDGTGHLPGRDRGLRGP
jgi:hypothetical protein